MAAVAPGADPPPPPGPNNSGKLKLPEDSRKEFDLRNENFLETLERIVKGTIASNNGEIVAQMDRDFSLSRFPAVADKVTAHGSRLDEIEDRVLNNAARISNLENATPHSRIVARNAQSGHDVTIIDRLEERLRRPVEVWELLLGLLVLVIGKKAISDVLKTKF